MEGEVLEWLNRRAWRARKSQGFVGSNPTLSATYSSGLSYDGIEAGRFVILGILTRPTLVENGHLF